MREVATIIVGGGISGASALHRLASAGADVLLLEAGPRLGGVIGSRRTALGALVETGPNSVQRAQPDLDTLIGDLGLDEAVVTASPTARKRFIVRDGRLIAAPMSPGQLVGTSLFSVAARLRLLREPFIAPAPEDVEESVAAFVERRLGREALDFAVDPFVSGVYAGDPERLSMRHAFGRLHALEQEGGSLVRGAIARRRAARSASQDGESTPPRRPTLVSFRDGMETLTRAIGERWSGRIRTGAAVEAIERDGERWLVRLRGEAIAVRRVVVATPGYVAASLVAPLDDALAGRLRGIEHPPVTTITSLYDRSAVAHPLDGFGCLVPSVEHRDVLGVIFSSSLFPDRAPEGFVALTTFVGGARRPEIAMLDDERLVAIVEREHAALLGASLPAREHAINRWPRAIPQYALGYRAVLDAIEAFEHAAHGLHLLGNYRGGVSVGDCVHAGFALADALAPTRG